MLALLDNSANMRFNNLLLVLCSLAAMSLAQEQKRAATTSFDESSALSAAAQLTSAYPKETGSYSIAFITPGGNLLQPPQSLVAAIITGVPASVIVQLAGSSGRAALASEFNAGNTPSWYESLPSGVKSYISALEKQIAGGSVDLSATPSSVDYYPITSSSTTLAGGVAVTSTKSKGAAAPTPGSRALGWSVAGVVGVLGVAVAL